MIGNSIEQQPEHDNNNQNKINNKKKKKSKKKSLAIKAYLVQLDESSGNQHNFSKQLIKAKAKNISTITKQNDYDPTSKWRIGTNSIQKQSVNNMEEKDPSFSLYDQQRDNLNHINIMEYDSGITLNTRMLKQSGKYHQKSCMKQRQVITKHKVSKKGKEDKENHNRTQSPLFWGNNFDINGELIIGAIKSPSKPKIASNSGHLQSQQKHQHFINMSISHQSHQHQHRHHTPIETVYSFLSDYNELFNTDNLLNKTYLTAENMVDQQYGYPESEDYDEFDLSANTSPPSTVPSSPYYNYQTKHNHTSTNHSNHMKATSSIQSFHSIYSLHQVRRTRSQFALLFSDNDEFGRDEIDEEEGSVISSLSYLDKYPVAARFDAYEGVKGIVLDMNMAKGAENDLSSNTDNVGFNHIHSRLDLDMDYIGSDTADTDTSIEIEEDIGRTQEGEKSRTPSANINNDISQTQSPSLTRSHSISYSNSNYNGFKHEFLVIIKNKSPRAIDQQSEIPQMTDLSANHCDVTDDEYQELFDQEQEEDIAPLPIFGNIRTPILERCESAPIQLIQSHSTDAMNTNEREVLIEIPSFDDQYQASMSDEEDELVILHMDSLTVSKSEQVSSSKNRLKSIDIFDDVTEFIREYEDTEKQLKKERKRWRKREREKRKRIKLKRHSIRNVKDPDPIFDSPKMMFAPKSVELPPKDKSPKMKTFNSERKLRIRNKKRKDKIKQDTGTNNKDTNDKQPELLAMDFSIKPSGSPKKRKIPKIQSSKSQYKEKNKKKVKAKMKRKSKLKSKSKTVKPPKPAKMRKAKTNGFIPDEQEKEKEKVKKRKMKQKLKKSKSNRNVFNTMTKKRKSAGIVEDRKKLKNRTGKAKKSISEKKRKKKRKRKKIDLSRAKTDKRKSKGSKRPKSTKGPRKASMREPTPRMSQLEIQLEEKYFEHGRQEYISKMITEMFGIEEVPNDEIKSSATTNTKASSSSSSHHCRTGPIYNGDDYLGEVFELDVDTILTHINTKSSLFSCTSPSNLCRQSSL